MQNFDINSPAAISAHIKSCMDFYHPRALDSRGGMYHFFKDDGKVYDARTRHLVSSTRYVFTYAMAYRQFGEAHYLAACEHALRFVREAHAQPSGGYAWTLDFEHGQARVMDDSNHCYGLAFVLLAFAHASMAGVPAAKSGIAQTFDLMEQRFWQQDYGLYADEADANWNLTAYRGQNANMHACEALLAAWDATQDLRYLHRAETLARHICIRQAALAALDNETATRIWEHYRADWSIDWDYNRDDPANLFRPWGFQPGHLAEWAKLLLLLERHAPHLQHATDWLLPKAKALFAESVAHTWDEVHGGLCYGFAPDAAICDNDKYHWVQAETLAASAMLFKRTGQAQYQVWYEKIWRYVQQHFIDHEHGAWYRILRADNTPYNDEKSPAGKVDYHNMGACYTLLECLAK